MHDINPHFQENTVSHAPRLPHHQQPLRTRQATATAVAITALVSGLLISGPSAAQAPASSPATSQSASAHGGRGEHGHRSDRGDPVAHTQQHLAQRNLALKITPAQEKIWQAYADQATRVAEAEKARRARLPDRAAIDKMAAPDRQAWQIEQRKQRLADDEVMNQAFRSLYAGLSAEQQALANQGMGHRGPRERHERHERHGGR